MVGETCFDERHDQGNLLRIVVSALPVESDKCPAAADRLVDIHVGVYQIPEVADDDVQRHVVVRVADEVIVNLMGRACGLSYAEAARDAESLERAGVRIPLASPATLIRTKDKLRPQDAIDRAFLEEVLRARAQPRKKS